VAVADRQVSSRVRVRTVTGTGRATADPAAPTLTVHGGAGGTSAALEDLESVGRQLDAAARALGAVCLRALAIAAELGTGVSTLWSAPTALEVERRMAAAIAGPHGLVVVSARLEALGGAVRAVALGYRAADGAAAAAMHQADLTVGRAVGALLVEPAGLVVRPALEIASAAVAGHGLLPAGQARGGPRSGSAVGAAAAAAGGVALTLMSGHTTAFEHGIDALPGVISGVITADPAIGVAGTAASGGPPRTVEQAARWIAGVAGSGGWLRESPAVAVSPAGPSAPAPVPRGLADLVAGMTAVDPDRGAPPGSVRIQSVRRGAGERAWLVQIPGTQDWGVRPGADPLDLTGDVQLMAGRDNAARRTVVQAMHLARIPAGEPVLLVGHSQGGIVAASLAADPEFRSRFRVTGVVTAGAPVAGFAVPAGVSVLSLEHAEDIVPRLDGRPNPDRSGWLTVSRATTPAGGRADQTVAHALDGYVATAAALDATNDPSVHEWRARLAPFVAPSTATVPAQSSAVIVTGVRAAPSMPPARRP
jgi:hypothetical protein